MLSQLKNNYIDQFFMNCIYKAFPPNICNFKLMVICGIDSNINKTIICCLIPLSKENEYTFKVIFKYLKDQYSFKPRRFMCDFNIAQIKAIQSIFPGCKLNTFFFHFSQAKWKNFSKYDLCGKDTYNNNIELLFNNQLINFMERGNIDSFFKEIKNKYKNNKYDKFCKYFERTWLGS